jgi:hypothetical protein
MENGRIALCLGAISWGLLMGVGQSQEVTHTWIRNEQSSSAWNRILEQLDRPAPYESHVRTLKDLPKYLPIPVVIDRRALRDASISDEEPLKDQAFEGQTLRSYLDMVLEDFELRWTIEYDCLVISTEGHGNVACLYDVTPLLTLGGDDRKSIATSCRSIMEVIESSVDPDCWESNSGTGCIVPWRLGDRYTLVVRAPVPTHLKIQDLFRSSQRMIALGEVIVAPNRSESTSAKRNGDMASRTSSIRRSRLKSR